MLRKALVVAAAITLPVTAATAMAGAGVAGATKAPVQSTTCAIAGQVNFANPGYSHDGSLSKKSSVKAISHINPTSGACGAASDGLSGYATINAKITAATHLCSNPGTVGAGDADVCAMADSKNKYWYNTTGSFVTTNDALTAIQSSLVKGVKAYNTGNKVTLHADNVGKVLPNGACGAAGVGFDINGSTSVSGLTYDMLLCLTSDSGANTTGSFLTDVVASLGGDASIMVASGTFGGNSALTFTKA